MRKKLAEFCILCSETKVVVWGMPENRRTPQDTAGHYCNDRRTPK